MKTKTYYFARKAFNVSFNDRIKAFTFISGVSIIIGIILFIQLNTATTLFLSALSFLLFSVGCIVLYCLHSERLAIKNIPAVKINTFKKSV